MKTLVSTDSEPDLDTSVVVVTGGAWGLGLGLALRCAKAGASVVIADIDSAAIDTAVRRLRATGSEAIGVQTDVTQSESIDELASRALDRFGHIDMVCSNAGVSMRGRAWELRPADWQWIFDVNVYGTVHCIRSFVPRMIAQGHGHFMTVASIASLTTTDAQAAYAASKHALLSIAESLMHDLVAIDSAVTASVVLPGAIRSRMADSTRQRPEKYGPSRVTEETLVWARQWLAERGTDPEELATRILQAVGRHEFYVFTREGDVCLVRERAAGIESRSLAPAGNLS